MSLLTAWYPFGLFHPRFNPFERLFQEFAPLQELEYPLLNVGESEKDFIITTELPGIDMKDIDISVTGRTASLKGEFKGPDKDIHYFMNERFNVESKKNYSKFARHITLPVPIDGQKIKAEYKEGLLLITLPKAEEAKPKTISIKVD